MPNFPFSKKEESTSHAKKGLKNISGTLLLIVSAPIIAILLTSHVFQSYQVDGQSMETTLQNGDRLIVNKLPKTIANIAGSTYLPARYDVVVIDRPSQSTISSNVDHLIKRVIALPGERIVIKDGTVTVFNQEFPEGFNPDVNQSHSESVSTTEGQVDITVGQEEIFVLGDNRFNSTDSRRFGAVNTRTVVGTAELRFVPIGSMKRL